MELSEALEALGNTPDEVATTLASKGCKGIRQSGDQCPVVMYLTIMGFEKACVGRTRASGRLYPNREYADLPLPVKEFVLCFDKTSNYPELEEQG